MIIFFMQKLDIISPEVNNYPTIWANIAAQSNSTNSTLRKGATTAAGGSSQGHNLNSVAQFAKATRGARVGSRAIRILRVIRLIRLIRIARNYKKQKDLAFQSKF